MCDAARGSFAYEPDLIGAEMLAVMLNDEGIMKANGCNQCAMETMRPVWLAPGDLCTLGDAEGPIHCATPAWANDYEPAHHVKACIPAAQLKKLWVTGHCHNVNTTLPYIGKEGLLFCRARCFPKC